MERNAIAGIAADRNEARITLTGIADQPGHGRGGDRPARRRRASQVDMIVHAATEGGARATSPSPCPAPAWRRRWRVIEPLREALGYAEMLTDAAVAKVSIVGVGIRSNPGLAATMFATLAERAHQPARGQRERDQGQRADRRG